jgi:hypothetical protein
MNPEPSVHRASINCHNSFILQQNHKRDLVLQDELAELAATREKIVAYKEIALFTENAVIKSLKFGLPPEPPPPPPPPPWPLTPQLDYVGAAPAPPKQVTLTEFVANLRSEVVGFEKRVEVLLAELSGCVRERTRTCGLPANEVCFTSWSSSPVASQ